jgi:hypothetical protein
MKAFIDRRLVWLCSCFLLLDFVLGEVTAPHCSDCFRPHGWPFRYRYEGGFAGGGTWVWPCLWSDFFWTVTVAVIAWAIWLALLSRERRAVEIPLRLRTWGLIRTLYGTWLFIAVIVTSLREIRGDTRLVYLTSDPTEFVGMMFGGVLFGIAALCLALSGVRMIRRAFTGALLAASQTQD